LFRLRGKANVAFVHDIVMAGLSFWLALYLRVGAETTGYYGQTVLLPGIALIVAIAAVVFWGLGLYRGIWRYASVEDLLGLTRAVTLIILVFVPVMFLLTRAAELPRSVPVINWALLLLMLGGPRFIYRIVKDHRAGLLGRRVRPTGGIPVLLVGASDAAELFIRAASRSPSPLYRPVGMIAEGRGRVGRNIHEVEVLGTFDEVPEVVERLAREGNRPHRLVLTRDLEGAVVRQLVETADQLGLAVARLPKLEQLRNGVADETEMRPVALEDLLGRPQTVLDREAMARLIRGKRVLVTGAGGSIGSELVRQVSALGPAALTLLENGEFALYTIDLEVAERFPGLARRAVIADIRDRARLAQIFAETRPELVFHAAALKHVPMVEANSGEGVLTNALGTRNVAELCREHGVAVMVQISTDKAVNPTSVMGVAKRLAESYCQALDIAERERAGDRGSATRYVTVRFGNVLGSTGSVVPLFQRQLAAGGPLTVTHPDVMRYFMTVREAVELVLQASVLGSEGDEPGKIFVLDMGEPVRIMDLARQMIRLAGLRPGVDVEIEVTGLRPGEKLFEEVFHGAEPLLPTACKGILLAAPRTADVGTLGRALDALAETCRTGDGAAIRAALKRLVPEYREEETGTGSSRARLASG
jgi:O-antigen biosynthesis protein WbqV